ncbi:MAG: chemotaxis protein CheB [Thermodesulfobacteriota bacterium]
MNGGSQNGKIKVLVVDDSVLIARTISRILESDGTIEVIGRARDGIQALEMIEDLKPDVVTLDVEMPKMDGITALKHIMVKHSTPTVMISALAREGSRTSFECLKYGAIDVIAKPSRKETESLAEQEAEILAKVRRAATIRTGRFKYVRVTGAEPADPSAATGPADEATRFIGITAGTGGYYTLLRIVPMLTSDFQEVIVAALVVSSRYVDPFATYLQAHCAIPVKVVNPDEALEKGVVYLAAAADRPVARSDGLNGLRVGLEGNSDHTGTEEAINDFLKSIAATVRGRAVGVIMTGSGSHGAAGIVEIRRSGGLGVIQDINNCVDPSMPLAALEKGTVEKILPDYQMAEFFMNLPD